MPFILIFAFGSRAIDRMRLGKMYPKPPNGHFCKKLILLLLYLPWFIFVTLLIILTLLIAGIPSMIVGLLPAWFYNVRRFRRTQLYWKGKSKQKQVFIPEPESRPEFPFPVLPNAHLLDEDEDEDLRDLQRDFLDEGYDFRRIQRLLMPREQNHHEKLI